MNREKTVKHTRARRLIVVFALGLDLGLSTRAMAGHTRITNPNAVSAEFLGRGLLWSVNFDRVVNDDLVAGAGFGTVSMRNADGSDAGVTTGAAAAALATIRTGSGSDSSRTSAESVRYSAIAIAS